MKEANPIFLPDGTEVKKGITIYQLDLKYTSSYESSYDKNESYIKTYSGKTRARFTRLTVATVNEAANARSFTARSAKGCESTFSVKNQCVGQLYGSLKSLKKKAKEINEADIETIHKKIKLEQISTAKYIKSKREQEVIRRTTIRKLAAIKEKYELCDC